MPRKDISHDPINSKNRPDDIRIYRSHSETAEGLIKKYQEVDKNLKAELAKKKTEQDKSLIERRREILKNVSHALAGMGIDIKKLDKVR